MALHLLGPLGYAEVGVKDSAVRDPEPIRFVEVKSGCQLIQEGVVSLHGLTWQRRNRVAQDRVVNVEGFPDSEGWILAVFNTDVNLLTQRGRTWGWILRGFDQWDAAIVGVFFGPVVDGFFEGVVVGRSTGELAGWYVGTIQQMPIEELPGDDPCPEGSISGTGQTVEATLYLTAPR